MLQQAEAMFFNLKNGGRARNNFKNNFVAELSIVIYMNSTANKSFLSKRQI
jgi:hypothetical protein